MTSCNGIDIDALTGSAQEMAVRSLMTQAFISIIDTAFAIQTKSLTCLASMNGHENRLEESLAELVKKRVDSIIT